MTTHQTIPSTRANFASRVIEEMRVAGLEGEIAHDEIAGTLVHAESGPFDLEVAFRHFTGPAVRSDNEELLRRVGRFLGPTARRSTDVGPGAHAHAAVEYDT